MKMYRAVLDGGHGVWVTGIDLAEARRAVTANHPGLEVDLHDVTELAELADGWDEVGAATAPAQICILARVDDGWRWLPLRRRVAVLNTPAGITAGIRHLLAAEARLAELDHELQQVGADGQTGYARAEERVAVWFDRHERVLAEIDPDA